MSGGKVGGVRGGKLEKIRGGKVRELVKITRGEVEVK